ncbi:MAG: hypothetical protein ACRENC_18720 [Gemmatimonadaceae bacterium]
MTADPIKRFELEHIEALLVICSRRWTERIPPEKYRRRRTI